MNCERAETLLDAFHDGELDPVAHREVESHVRACARCAAVLNEIAWFDQLLIDLPRVQPDPSLRGRIFNSPEFQEILRQGEASQHRVNGRYAHTGQTLPPMQVPGTVEAAHPPSGTGQMTDLPPAGSSVARAGHRSAPLRRKRSYWPMRALQIAAVLLLALGVGLLAAQKLAIHPATTSSPNSVPLGVVAGPLPSGVRFVYDRAGQLWSNPEAPGGVSAALTPKASRVAGGWTVSPTGDHIAYIDQNTGALHVVQADGQNDQIIVPHIAHPGAHSNSFWSSVAGQAILRGLAWSPDGQRLAFIGDLNGTGTTGLYVVNPDGTGLMPVSTPDGSITQSPVWSPLSVRIAYEQEAGGVTSIWEYNLVRRETLEVAAQANPGGAASDVVHTLAWNSDTQYPAVTWSAGPAGSQAIDSIWARHVGVADSSAVALAQGAFAFADYSAGAASGAWLYPTDGALDMVTVTGSSATLASGVSAVLASWSPDGTRVIDVDTRGALQMQALSGGNIILAEGVTTAIAPVWSPDGRQIALVANGTLQIVPASGGHTRTIALLPAGVATLSWSPDGHTLVAMGTGNLTIATLKGNTERIPASNGVQRVEWTRIA